MAIDLIVAGASLVIASVALLRAYQPAIALKRLTKAFEELEDEWEEKRASLQSTLGRISRLKRDIMPSPIPSDGGPATDADANADQVNGLTARQAAKQREILNRRSRGLLQR